MAVRQITTKLTVDGEQEFKRQLSAVNRELGNLGAEMKLVDAQFKGQANSAEALREKQRILSEEVANSENKVKALEAALKEATAAYGEGDARVDKYQKSLLTAQRQLVETNRALDDTTKYLKEAEDSADGCATSIDGFGKEVKKAADETDGLDSGLGSVGDALANLRNSDGSFNLKNVLGALGELKGALVGGAIVTGAKEVVDAIFEIVDSTAEYRKIMGTLETSSAAAGYTTEETKKVYEEFQAVLGDTQTAATATANLQAIGLEQQKLRLLVDETIGAWATYGDSIPIDSLTESINETIQVGKVVGVFADALNWAGVNEDDFNARLDECADKAARANLVLMQLAEQGLAETGKAWKENNQDIMTMNHAQEELNSAMARLGELLTPAAAGMLEFAADCVGAAATIVEAIADVIDKVQEAKQAFDELAEKNAALGVAKESTNWLQKISFEGMISQVPFVNIPYNLYKGVKRLSGSHADGLDRVPYDGYIAELHANEAVLNAQEAALWRSAARTGTQTTQRASTPTPSPASFQAVSQRQSITLDATFVLGDTTVARHLYPLMQSESRRRGTPLAGKEGT